MTYYFGSLLPEYRGALIVGYHGYRAKGHRIAVFETDAGGLPTGKVSDLVAGWDAAEGQPMGAPTDLKVGADGAIYVTEDRNGTVVRIARQQ
jgi:glucose/arabinose dehydrogenase